ncbi:unnamed protein product [Calicophoron daubneyi]|uniref:Uncharacterized protein n=1 Tax=Calicophoron daubneyi TaxID=300641 RepID=A0AAV2TUS7_CALDB
MSSFTQLPERMLMPFALGLSMVLLISVGSLGVTGFLTTVPEESIDRYYHEPQFEYYPDKRSYLIDSRLGKRFGYGARPLDRFEEQQKRHYFYDARLGKRSYLLDSRLG